MHKPGGVTAHEAAVTAAGAAVGAIAKDPAAAIHGERPGDALDRFDI